MSKRHIDEKGRYSPAKSRITKKYRVIARGYNRSHSIAERAAKTAVEGGSVSDKHEGKMLQTRSGLRYIRDWRQYNKRAPWKGTMRPK